MADSVSKAARHRIMAAIRGRDNRTTELALAQELRQARISGWRRHLPLPGTPDFAWPASRVAVFVDGCFWHGCPAHYRPPSTRKAFWAAKIEGNKRRDRKVDRSLRLAGWKVVRVWECQVRQARAVRRIGRLVASRAPPGIAVKPGAGLAWIVKVKLRPDAPARWARRLMKCRQGCQAKRSARTTT